MTKRLSFVIVYLILLIPSYLFIAAVLILGFIGCIILWVIFGKDLDGTTDKVFDLIGWIADIPYKMFGYNEW